MAKKDDKLVEQYEKDYESMTKYWGDLHKSFKEDTKFLWFNDQWSTEAKSDRQNSVTSNNEPLPPRPMEVFNILKPFVIKVINGIKKMKPSLKVIPADSASDPDLAEVRRGVIRAVERNGGAVPARLQGVKDQVGCGFGFYGFKTDFEDPKSRHQEFKYRTFEDATQVLYDDDSKEPDGSDCMKAIVYDELGEDEFERVTGKKWEDFYEFGETHKAWGSGKKPIIAEWWKIEQKPETLYFVNDVGYYLSELKDMSPEELLEVSEGKGISIDSIIDYDHKTGEPLSRESFSRTVYCRKMVGKKIIKEDKWPGYWIPIFKLEGRKTVCDGEVNLDGLTPDGKASQKSYNYSRNANIERMALAPKVPWAIAVGGIPKKYKYKWDTANIRNWSTLEYNATDEVGNPLPPPQRQMGVQVDPGLSQESMVSRQEMKDCLGLYGSYTGDVAQERSGRAILAGASESQDIVYDFAYNFGITVQHENRVLNEVLGKVIDVPRQVKMVGEDDTEKVVMVNQPFIENGKDQYYDLRVGKFDIYYEVGPSDESKRMETREGIKDWVNLVGPQHGVAFSDLMAKESDFRYKDEVAKRAEYIINQMYPGMIEKDGQPPQEVLQMQQQMQQMNEQMQFLMQENQQLKTDKSIEMQKIQSQNQQAEEKNEVEIFNAETKRMQVEQQAEDDRQDSIQAEKDSLRKHSVDVAKTNNEKAKIVQSMSKPPKFER